LDKDKISVKNIAREIEYTAALYPQKTAIVFETKKISYKDLNSKSNQVAHYLKSSGIVEGDIVPVLSDNSINLIVAILGIIKAGAAYVSINSNMPVERVSWMLDEINYKTLLYDSQDVDIAFKNAVSIDYALELETKNSNLNITRNPESLAYIIFTSGSEGVPKGVPIKLKSFCNLLDWFINDYGICSFDRTLLYLSPSFDAAQKNFFAPSSWVERFSFSEITRYNTKKFLNVLNMM
jgi:non-ribosomal peptide synthetase component F